MPVSNDRTFPDLIVGNGVDGTTGELLLSGIDAEAFAAGILQREADRLTELLAKANDASRRGKLALPFGTKVDDLASSGWGLVLAPGIGREVKEALQPLIEHRQAAAGSRTRIFEGLDALRPDEAATDFLIRHEVDPVAPDPAKVPYHLLLVGGPEAIPHTEYAFLATQYRVGRLDLDGPEAYANYAGAIVAHERRPAAAPVLQLFGPRNSNDAGTPLSVDYLLRPIAEATFARTDIQRRSRMNADATKPALKSLLARADGPRVVVTASHGVAMPAGDPQQDALQGALLCQEWPGPKSGPVQAAHCFAAADVDAGIDLTGTFAILYACFGGGTPRQDEFWFAAGNSLEVKPLAPRAFTASLVKRLLGHATPPVAILAHVDRAWGSAFYSRARAQHARLFIDVINHALGGSPLGAALGLFAAAAASHGQLVHKRLGAPQLVRDKKEFLHHWIAERDARGYCLFGDPATRLTPQGR
jgi:hypothetical protein